MRASGLGKLQLNHHVFAVARKRQRAINGNLTARARLKNEGKFV